MSAIAAFAPPTSPRTKFRRISSVFLVEEIEPCLEFWIDRLGFELRLRVEGERGLDFAILGRDDVEVMYRTRASIQQASPGLIDGESHQPWVVLYVEVADLDALLPRLEGIEVVVPLRESIVGDREIIVREPSGRLVALTSHD
jgi:Glyoxalase/Bleomycin resistance protein/Dioxygenase superfamily